MTRDNFTIAADNHNVGARKVSYCAECLMPDSRPRITFDANGVCNACLYSRQKFKDIDWDERKREFEVLLDSFRSNEGEWDCVVPWSGGKDSSTIAWKLKYEYGMNPLLVTFSPMMPTVIGNNNREKLLNAGFDSMFLRPNQRVHRHIARRFFIERGNPKVAWDAGINAVPIRVALQFGIRLVVYAEHGETEYGGRILHEESEKKRDFTEVIEHQVGDDARNWIDEVVSERDLQPYIYPASAAIQKAGLVAYYFAYFHKWSMFENYNYLKNKIDFETHPFGRTSGTFTNFDSLDDKMDPLYYYMQYVKFGFGRCIRDTSRFIQNGHMSRDEGLRLCRMYDGEFPYEYFDEVLEYLRLSKEEFEKIVDKHRNPEIWKHEGGSWVLRYPPN